MKKLYLLAIALLVSAGMYAQQTVLVVSEALPDDDANVQGIMDAINSIDDVTAEHMAQSDYGSVDDFTQWDAVFLTENGGSDDMTAVQDAGWQVPVVSLKAYALYKGDNPLFAQEDGVNWIAATKGEANADPANGATTIIVDDNESILCNYDEGEEVEWSTAFDDGQEEEAHWQTFDLGSSDDVQISASATPVGINKAAFDESLAVNEILWTVEENETTKRIVAWGVHHFYLAAATDDFYQIATNSVEWALGMEISACESDDPGTSVENIRAGGFEMYPNPVEDVLTISNASYIAHVEIVDLTGKVVVSQNNSFSSQMKINTSELTQGMYIIKITATDGKNFTDKLIK